MSQFSGISIAGAISVISWPILLSALFMDLLTKWWAQTVLHLERTVPVIDGLLAVHLQYNPAAAYGSLASVPGVRPMLVLVSLATLACLLLVTAKRSNTATRIGTALTVGGGLGNTLERVFHAPGVTDFLIAGAVVDGAPAAVFNVADVFILVGALTFLAGALVHVAQNRKPGEPLLTLI